MGPVIKDPASSAKKKNIFYIGLLSFFGGISQDVFAPILPIYLTSVLGFDKLFVGVAEGLVTAGVNIFRVFAGYFSDKFKKQKPIIFAGYFFSMVGRASLAFFTSGVSVLGLRALDGIGKGIKDPPKDVLIAGSAAKEVRGRGFGVVRMLDTLGSVAGPLILFLLLYFLQGRVLLYHYILLFSAVPLLAVLFITIAKVKEAPAEVPSERAEAITPAKLSRSFYLFLAVVIVFTLGNSSDAFLILRAKGLGVTLLEIPLVIALFNLIYALAAVPFGSLSDRIGRIPTMLIGWFSYALVYLGFAVAGHALLVWFLYGFYGIYYATNEGVGRAFIADLVSSEHRGRAFGIYGTAVGIATLPASFIAGFLWDHFGPQMPFYFGAAMAVIAATLLFLLSKNLRQREQ